MIGGLVKQEVEDWEYLMISVDHRERFFSFWFSDDLSE
jgi:hypothetical protein